MARATATGALRVITHNVRGLLSSPARIPSLVRQWCHQRADVVCLQETHVGFHQQYLAEARVNALATCLRAGRWKALWDVGVAARAAWLLLRTDLLSRGTLRVLGGDAAVRRGGDGRMNSLPLATGSA